MRIAQQGETSEWRLSSDFELHGLFQALRDRKISYVVLNWFELSPAYEERKPIMLLVCDEHAELLESLIAKSRTERECKVYSTTGLPGFAYEPWGQGTGGIAAFSPRIAKQILADAVEMHGLCRIPAAKHRFFITTYCAVYLKATPALSHLIEAPEQLPAHFLKILSELAAEADVPFPEPATMDSLEKILADHGWQPPRDMLMRMAAWNPWIKKKFHQATTHARSDGLAVFFIRSRAVENGLAPHILHLLEGRGFQILHIIQLSAGLQQQVAAVVRGGNWGRGPWPVSGGEPAIVAVGLDVMPIPVTETDRRQHPELDNARIMRAKETLRAELNRSLPPDQRYNAIHSTDNSAQAWECIEWLCPEKISELEVEVRRLQAVFKTDDKVLADLTSYGNRAKIEIIEFEGRPAVKKTFRESALANLKREVDLLTFCSYRPEVARILRIGRNFLITPLYENAFKRRVIRGRVVPRLMPLGATRQLAGFVKFLLANGYDPIDLAPHNILLDRKEGLKIIDFEFVYRHTVPPACPELGYCFIGAPAGFEGDTPLPRLQDPYNSHWYPCLFLSLHSFLYDPPWLQRLKRSINYPLFMLSWGLRHLKEYGIQKLRK